MERRVPDISCHFSAPDQPQGHRHTKETYSSSYEWLGAGGGAGGRSVYRPARLGLHEDHDWHDLASL
jgi:hypothetical protein